MKIVYLIQGRDDPEQAIQLANALSIDDYVVLTLNDNKWIDEAYYLFNRHRNIHLSTSTAFATVGDLSASRTWLYQLKEACEKFKFDYAINLTEHVMPTKTRAEIVEMLTHFDGESVFSVKRNSEDDEALKKQITQYFVGTNAKQFALRESYRKRMQSYASILYSLGIRRKIDFTIYEGEPWFALNYNMALAFGNELKFASEHFILSWYSERFVIQTMWKQFVPHQTYVNDYLVASDAREETTKPFKTIPHHVERKDIAGMLKHYNPIYEPPYDYIAEEIVQAKKSMLDSIIDYFKKFSKKK
jgi:hypothetical protein